MWRIAIWGAAAVMIVLGLLTVLLPIPTGVPLLAGGAMLILSTSPSAARWLRRRRRGSGWLNGWFTWLEQRAPLRLARILGRSRPRQK
ncbi:hypothetical protein [Pannonibacter sp.]|uniref:hypothetical protein n=1 Tax=Pannonibacter sp. TaxID=1906786 RepID=UPI003F6F0B8F